jgi:hypothetical protein
MMITSGESDEEDTEAVGAANREMRKTRLAFFTEDIDRADGTLATGVPLTDDAADIVRVRLGNTKRESQARD